MSGYHRQQGLSLVELIAAMAVLGVALAGILFTINASIARSADPMVQEQASALAQAYIEELGSKAFCDPDFSANCASVCTTSACGTCAGAIGAAETRVSFDDVCDYNGLRDVGARDQFNNAIVQLSQYTVAVNVSSVGESLNGLTSNSGAVVRATVTVTHASMPNPVVLSVYRANY